jgi:hypothetical protein
MTPDKESVVFKLAVFVVLLWGAVIIASFFLRDYTVLAAVSPVMLIVCGYLFGYKGRSPNG